MEWLPRVQSGHGSSLVTFDVHDSEAVELHRRNHGLDPHVIRKFRNSLLRKFETDDSALSHLPETMNVQLHSLSVKHRMDSALDGATRLLLQTSTSHVIECVILRIASGRSTICVSSQVGCAAACDFCATGKLGIAKNLAVREILDQVVLGGQILTNEGRRLDNIVFMGMGEPFHNSRAVTDAIRKLTDRDLFARSPASILVSTVGIPEKMTEFAETLPGVNLALSLHSADSEKRRTLIPLESKHPLKDLHEAIRQVNQLQGRPLMIEYLMLDGVNDSHDAANQLIRWVQGLNIRFNLIPFNAIEDAPHLMCSPREAIDRFAQQLREAGYQTTVRYSLGADIAAACGQLARTLQPVQDQQNSITSAD